MTPFAGDDIVGRVLHAHWQQGHPVGAQVVWSGCLLSHHPPACHARARLRHHPEHRESPDCPTV
eukprot:8760342-Pyramimonas_sp.AAC.2